MPFSSLGVGAVRSLLLRSRKRRSATDNVNNHCACTIAATDITTTVGVSAREADDHSSKRARNLRHNPPSLEISATFESASSSPTSSTSSPSASSLSCHALATLTSENVHSGSETGTVNPARRTYSSNEYYTTAISCAKSRLHAAQRMSLHSEQNLSRAKEECERSKLEIQRAKALLDAVEMKWGVINIESDDENNDNDATRQLKTLNRACAGTTATTGISSVNEQTRDLNYDDKDEVADTVQLIQVRIAGESRVHGRYHLYHPTTSHGTVTRSATSIQHILPTQYFIHDDGPFQIQNIMYDLCVFQRGGYGDKVRWCIGLVPCEFCNCNRSGLASCCDTSLNEDIGSNDKENNEDGSTAQLQQQLKPQRRYHDRVRNFALAYIYYWMEVDATAENITCLFSKDVTGESEPSEPSWYVCHGIHPLPVLEDATVWTDTGRWWQVWK